ncbi:MAG: RNA polymerase sigma factor [Desulfomonilaceae bacterium]
MFPADIITGQGCPVHGKMIFSYETGEGKLTIILTQKHVGRGLRVPEAAPENDFRSLIERCNCGDREAWAQFYALCFPLVSLAVRRISYSDPEDNEDTIQDVFVQLFKALRAYDPARSLQAYVLEIARRVAIGRLRNMAAAKRGGLNPGHKRVNAHDCDDDEEAVAVASPHADQEVLLIKAQEGNLLRKALGNVTENCRRLLLLRYEQELSYKEIAKTTGVKEPTLRVRVQRCLSALGERYSELSSKENGT